MKMGKGREKSIQKYEATTKGPGIWKHPYVGWLIPYSKEMDVLLIWKKLFFFRQLCSLMHTTDWRARATQQISFVGSVFSDSLTPK